MLAPQDVQRAYDPLQALGKLAGRVDWSRS
jgi:hypothetical protein